MKIKPTQSFKLIGSQVELIEGNVYDAIPATNQPNYEKNESIFAGDISEHSSNNILLHKGEYEIVDESTINSKR